MNQLKEKIRKLEMELWKRAQNRDSKAYLEIVSENAVMVCGGFRCTGKEYAGIISEFDVASYNGRDYETVFCSEELVQNHYVIETKVKEERNKDLEGIFHVTSTWKKENQEWKLIYNMDSRIIE